jgi:hypothetical protein
MFHMILPKECVIDVQNGPARITEQKLYTLIMQRAYQRLSTR